MKKCPQCNAQLEDDVKFCTSCGASVGTPDAKPGTAPAAGAASKPVKPAKTGGASGKSPFKLSKKTLAVCAGVLAAVIFIILLIVKLSSGGSGNFIMKKQELDQFASGDKVYFVNSDGTVVEQLVGNGADKISDVCESTDGRYSALIAGDAKTALFFDGKTVFKVADGVETLYMSNDGKTLVYTDANRKIFSYKNEKSTLVAENADLTAVSPDAKTVGYIRSTGDESIAGYYAKGGKEYEIGKNRTPCSISNDAGTVLVKRGSANDFEYTYHVQSKTDEDSIVMLKDMDVDAFITNFDGSEVLYYTSDDATYLAKTGAEPVKVSSDHLLPLFPYGTNVCVVSVSSQRYLLKSFGKTFYLASNDKLVYVNEKMQAQTVAEEIVAPVPADDEKTVFYLKDGSLYKVDGTKRTEPTLLVEETVAKYCVTSGGKTVFYLTKEGLYSKKGTSKPKLVTDRVSDVNVLFFTDWMFDGDTLFFFIEDEIFSSKGGKAVKVETFDHNINFIRCSPFSVEVFIDRSGAADGSAGADPDVLLQSEDVYFSKDGKKFELILNREGKALTYD